MHWVIAGGTAGGETDGVEPVGAAAPESAAFPASVPCAVFAVAGRLSCCGATAGWPPDELWALDFSAGRCARVAWGFGEAVGGDDDGWAGATGSGSGRGRSSGLSFPSLQLTPAPRATRTEDAATMRVQARGIAGS